MKITVKQVDSNEVKIFVLYLCTLNCGLSTPVQREDNFWTWHFKTVKWEEILIGILDELGIDEHHRNILPSWPGLTVDKNIQQNGKIYDQDRASGGPSHTYIIRLCVHPCTRHLHVSHKPLQWLTQINLHLYMISALKIIFQVFSLFIYTHASLSTD